MYCHYLLFNMVFSAQKQLMMPYVSIVRVLALLIISVVVVDTVKATEKLSTSEMADSTYDVNCTFEINLDSSDLNGYPYSSIYIYGTVTLDEPANVVEGVVAFQVRCRTSPTGQENAEAFLIEMIDASNFKLVADFSPALWGDVVNGVPDTLYLRLNGANFSFDGSIPNTTYYSNTVELNMNQTVTGVEERFGNRKRLTAYPNPCTDQLSLVSETLTQISDVMGKVVVSINPRKGINVIDVSRFPAGMYFLQDENGNTAKVLKR